ncbi:39S ribosomal protein L46, mitochondrial [Teleopsis dalmanni]|uniref:39S ribosomal protein L46, mitochondrial n=1 Tax=Teleopsis dalmanni TaxID=139649 RepID=UPI0018CDFF3B|nr:39S ribosomal protein L46, mitochondrial [Teleopsis dalmanni]
MLRQLSKLNQIHIRKVQKFGGKFSFATVAPNTTEKWDLYAGVLVERLPVVSKSLTPFEQNFQEHLWRVEFENSLKSNHEQQHERDIFHAEKIKKGEIEIDLDDASAKQTAQDLKDAYTEELKKFKPASRLTKDDSLRNLTSTNRCLEETLYLLVEHKLGKQMHFLLPQGPRKDGETMRQTAERILQEKCGDHLNVTFYGHAPCGFYKYKYPSSMRAESQGAKVFFYRATLNKGNVNSSSGVKFEWLEKAALEEKFQSKLYSESVKKFLL